MHSIILYTLILLLCGVCCHQAAAVTCPTANNLQRARCLCNTLKLDNTAANYSLPDEFLADTELGCAGAFRCNGIPAYKKCGTGKLFDESTQTCKPAQRVSCTNRYMFAAQVCASGGPITTTGSCGANRAGGYCCPEGMCCSLYGVCGWTEQHCNVNNGCQTRYGMCTGTLNNPSCTFSVDGTCGASKGGTCCGLGSCCSSAGYCGTSAAHCGTGCQAAFGQCGTSASPSPSPKPSPGPSPKPSPSPSPKPSPSPSPKPSPSTSPKPSPSPSPSPPPKPSPSPSPSPAVSPKPSPSPAPQPSPSPGPPLLPSGPLNVAYYETWDGPTVTSGLDIERIPAYVNIILLAFAKPDCSYTKGSLEFYYFYRDSSGQTRSNITTGLLFNSPGSAVKAAIANLKATRPNTRVLLSVGGSAYQNFAGLNVQCIKDLVDDFGLDGIDLDYEPASAVCSSSPATGVSCNTDAEQAYVTTALRQAFPAGQYIMSTATWHVGAYGEGAFANAAPPWASNRGINLAMAKSPAGQTLDLIMIMAYLIGGGYDWREAYRAHKAAWPNAAVTIGGMIPPDEWGTPLTLQEAVDRAVYARDNAAGKGYGTMLWTLQLSTGCPNPQQVLQAVCNTYSMGNCSIPLPFAQRNCGNGTTPPPTSPTPGCPGGTASGNGDCGFFAGFEKCCPQGYCCSMYGFCGTTETHCDLNLGCQALYGKCTGGPVPSTCTNGYSPSGRCGPANGSYCCTTGNCCSAGGYCGTTDAHCGSGCQQGYGKCN